MGRIMGKQSIAFDNPPYILEGASIVGQKEGEGPMGKLFDVVEQDPMLGQDTWEDAESLLQKEVIQKLLFKSNLSKEDIRYIFAGDLLGQLIATTFGILDFEIPFFGLYGACSTIGEALSIAAITVDGENAENVIAIASSHFASAERQFRFPLAYGNQRPYAATWTVTGAGAVVVSKNKGFAKITGITTGIIVDYGVKDAQNMGACMAPAAADTLYRHFKDFNTTPEDYDKIITGDLGIVGKTILMDLLREKGYDISKKHMDCGVEMFDGSSQDTHAGGSGCGCAATILTSYIFKQLKKKVWKKILFVPTGALMSPVSFNEGNSVPGIAHLVQIEAD
ncbi:MULTISPECIES: stage V sporulation protein AD [Eubacterium]|jgi:stage V sporulation protein AD|uniref:stage V sporulation protein AD n=1 Tax=Eubacterium TaxID=1730 RepID=UPI000E495654|nr:MULTISPECIES: stage V sporulation protein AD [Eubacterium]MBS5620291.1 stage V sporulation protein AD [Eubacterium sp.]MEE0715695.1 stage V sporulation protein AD [Eubacterium sp.]RGF52486.1 stage V sporulation protein AD [Eubacterium sp. AF36-5BH]RHP22169.1 stage V sporulation protein AD [Eubacterium sp. AF34-35BH]